MKAGRLFRSRTGQMLLQSVLALLAVGYVLYRVLPALEEIYFGPLSTDIGLVVNGIILVLFLIALLRQLYLLVVYFREERALELFLEQLDFGLTEAGLEPIESSLIVRRYRLLQQSVQNPDPVQQTMLAAMLRGQEVARLGLVRLVHSLLILLGVFGTVLSLSLALAGASELFASPQSVAGISTVVRGMATALSTTMTAIAAYLVLAFVFSRLSASQTQACQRVEWLTMGRLLPLASAPGNLPTEMHQLLKELRGVSAAMAQMRRTLEQFAGQSELPAAALRELGEIRTALQQGFRLGRGGS